MGGRELASKAAHSGVMSGRHVDGCGLKLGWEWDETVWGMLPRGGDRLSLEASWCCRVLRVCVFLASRPHCAYCACVCFSGAVSFIRVVCACVLLWRTMILYGLVGIIDSEAEARRIFSGQASGAVPIGLVLGIYQDSIWVGFAGSLGPRGQLSAEFGGSGPLAEIGRVVAGGAVGEATVWEVSFLDVSALVRRFGFPRGHVFWVVRYISFSHGIRQGVYISEGRDYR